MLDILSQISSPKSGNQLILTSPKSKNNNDLVTNNTLVTNADTVLAQDSVLSGGCKPALCCDTVGSP